MALDPSWTPRLRPRPKTAFSSAAADAARERHVGMAAVDVARGDDDLSVVTARPEIGQERHRPVEIRVDRDDVRRVRLPEPGAQLVAEAPRIGRDGNDFARDLQRLHLAAQAGQEGRRVPHALEACGHD